MLVVAFGLLLTAVLFINLESRRGLRAANLGSMSSHWISAFRASQQAWSR